MTKKNKLFYFTIYVFWGLCIFFIIRTFSVYGRSIRLNVLRHFQEEVIAFQSPVMGYMNESRETGGMAELSKELIKEITPIYTYSEEYPQMVLSYEDEQMIEQILLSEGRDEYTDMTEEANYEPGNEQIVVGNEGTSNSGNEQIVGENEGTAKSGNEQIVGENEGTAKSGNEQTSGENTESEQNPSSSVLREEPVQEVSLEELKDFNTLLSKYYVVDGTSVNEEQLNVSKLLSYDMTLKTTSDKPQILIYHTHSQEGFADSDLQNPATTIVGAGEKLTNLLRGYGFNVIHDTGQYDVPNRDNAYSVAAPAIEEILEQNPSIEVIIDLHRDGVADTTRLVTELNGKKMAQFMFLNGLSRTEKGGEIEYLKNENIDENLAFSFQAQLVANKYYPSLARKIYLKGYRFNMHYRGKYMLIELGAQTNTVEEIMNAVEPIAHILQMTLTKGA